MFLLFDQLFAGWISCLNDLTYNRNGGVVVMAATAIGKLRCALTAATKREGSKGDRRGHGS